MLQNGSDFFPRCAGWLLPKPGEVASAWDHDLHQHAERGSLAAPVGAEHSKDLTPLYFKVKLIDGTEPTEIFGEAVDG